MSRQQPAKIAASVRMLLHRSQMPPLDLITLFNLRFFSNNDRYDHFSSRATDAQIL